METLVRVNATYPWFGDSEPWVWMTNVLAEAKENEQIVDFEITSAKPPLSVTDQLMNIEFVAIMTDFDIEDAEVYERAFKLVLDDIVRDIDVEIHSITPVKE